MKRTLKINPTEMFNAPLLFYIICGAQIGVGIHGFQRIIYEYAKQDSWMSVIISFIAAHIVVFIMFKTLEIYGTNDVYGIHLDLFGKFVGNVMNIILIFYCGMAFFLVVKNYTEVINTWVFPSLNPSFITITLLIIVAYGVTGGIRVIVGICFFSFFFPLWILIVLLYPLEYSHINYILPILDNNLIDILKGAYAMSFSIVGFELIASVYPFIKEKDKAKKYAHFGLLATFFIYIFIMLITLTFFTGEQLQKTIWATLSLFSIVRLPFLERIELITICFWMVIILPNMCLYAWSAYRGFTRMSNISVKGFMLIFSILIFIGSLMVKSRTQINEINNYFGQIAFYVVFVYPFFVYIIASIKNKFSKQRVNKS